MLSEWSAESSADDPVLVVPWADPSDSTGNRRFIDLRENPYDLDHLPEAELYPPLMHALRALNATRSPVFTAKCDAWLLDADNVFDRLRGDERFKRVIAERHSNALRERAEVDALRSQKVIPQDLRWR